MGQGRRDDAEALELWHPALKEPPSQWLPTEFELRFERSSLRGYQTPIALSSMDCFGPRRSFVVRAKCNAQLSKELLGHSADDQRTSEEKLNRSIDMFAEALWIRLSAALWSSEWVRSQGILTKP